MVGVSDGIRPTKKAIMMFSRLVVRGNSRLKAIGKIF
jgi:hypothetical protein